MRRRSRPSPALRLAVRAGAIGVVGAAVAVPLLRRRLRVPAPVTVAACAGGPARARRALPALEEARRRPLRDADVGLHHGPRDPLSTTPSACAPASAAATRSSVDRVIGAGRLPNARLQRGLARLPQVGDRQPLPHLDPLALVLRALRGAGPDPRPQQRALPARRPPDGRRLRPRLRRLLRGADGAALVVLRAGADRRKRCGGSWSRSARRPGARPGRRCTTRSAATPGRRCPRCTSPPRWSAALSLAEAGKVEGALGWTYAGTLGFALVYLGEHYVTDLLAGAALVAAVRRGEPLAEPLVHGVNRGLQRLERLASG